MFDRRLLLLVALVFVLAGCRKDYDKKDVREIPLNTTAFVFPTDSNLVPHPFSSVQELDKYRVKTADYVVPHVWEKTDYSIFDRFGIYRPLVRIVLVNRSMFVQEWSCSETLGFEHNLKALWAESNEHVVFSIGFNINALIEESQAANFLFHYQGATLAEVVDGPVRTEVGLALKEYMRTRSIDDVLLSVGPASDFVREKALALCNSTGIKLTSLMAFPPIMYRDPNIRDAMHELNAATIYKLAQYEFEKAQDIKARAILIEANALAEKELRIASAKNAGEILLLETARLITKTPELLKIKQIELEREKVAKWDGKYPSLLFVKSGEDQTPLDANDTSRIVTEMFRRSTSQPTSQPAIAAKGEESK